MACMPMDRYILNLRGVSFVLFGVSLQKGPCTENEQ